MAMKWSTKLEVTEKMCPIVCQGRLSNFEVTGDKKSPILTQIEHFRTVTPVWIRRWLWNDAQSLKYYRGGALLFLRPSIIFPGHMGPKINDLNPILSKNARLVAAVKSLRFAVFQSQTLFCSYLRNGWSNWCEMKRKCIDWILGTICDLDPWPHSWPSPWMFQGQISK